MNPLKEQILATSPERSIWLSASAGTGKTFVLVNRLIRLILEGNDPRRIVCITYTKAAATEMQERVIKYIGDVILLNDIELKNKLDSEFEANIDLKKLSRTRKKLISIIDHPQQLKIQTIHSFCEGVLKHFPLEAETPAFFEVIDDFGKSELVEEAWKKLIFSVDAKVREAVEFLLSRFKPLQIKELLNDLLQQKAKLLKVITLFGGYEGYISGLKELLNITQENKQELETLIFNGNKNLFSDVLMVLEKGGTNEKKLGVKLRKYFISQKIEELAEIFLTEKDDGFDVKKILTKQSEKDYPNIFASIIEFQRVLLGIINGVKDIDIFANTKYFLRAFEKFNQIYEGEKAIRYVLEFDDLIERTANLLRKENPNREWVLYKLDGGIDHILIDEAQDTNESQWQIIDAITDEFFSGQVNDAGLARSLFVVGDEKQSIYSFQGADVRVFSDRQSYYEARKKDHGINFESVRLNRSFRSGAAVIDVVNKVVANKTILAALTKSGHLPEHEIADSMKTPQKFGYFEINKLVDVAVRAKASKEVISWNLPREYEEDEEEKNIDILAGRIAGKIKDILARDFILPATGKRPTPGDIMVLVKKRKGIASVLIEKLQELEIPVSGIDRLNLNDSLAIKDLLALAKFSILKNDDLNFACLLKSAFISFNEDELFDVCWNRGSANVHESFLAKAAGNIRYGQAAELLEKLAAQKDSVFEFFYDALEAMDMRRNFISYFGRQINEILDEFLMIVKKFEDSAGGGLQHFINWFEKNEVTVKRNLEAGNEVRIITAHGAKGLEAPIVVIPDTTSGGGSDAQFCFGDNIFLCPVIKDYRNELFKKIYREKQALELEEYYRLLYVALTRAKNELYLFGHTYKGIKANNWHNMVLSSVGGMCAEDEERFSYTTPEYITQFEKAGTPSETAEVIDLTLFQRKFSGSEEIEVISPSALYRTENNQKFSLERVDFTKGLAVHKLLEILPEIEEHEEAAEKILNNYFVAGEEETKLKAKNEAFSVLKNAEFNFIFTGKSKAEVPVCGFYMDKFISGKIDRLVELGAGEILIVDYKTNDIAENSVPRVMKKYSAQMMAYKHLLEKIYPDKNIKAALLFTAVGRLVYV